MNMTMQELYDNLLAKDAIATYDNDDNDYIDGGFMLEVDGQTVVSILSVDDGFKVEFDDGSRNRYEADELVGAILYCEEEF